MSRLFRLVCLLGWMIGGCAPLGVGPSGTSAAQHEQEAEDHARAAEEHEAQFDPSPRNERLGGRARQRRWWLRGCRKGAVPADLDSDVCWTMLRNPTAVHLAAAREHARQASEHRTASSALREAEARACIGIAPADRDISPFEHTEDIASVAPLNPRGADSPTIPWDQAAGAIVTFRMVEGMTTEWLQRVIDCHLARNASLGHVVPEMPDCPLVPRGVEARVSSVEGGLVVTIRATEPSATPEVLLRARRLLPAAPDGPTPTR